MGYVKVYVLLGKCKWSQERTKEPPSEAMTLALDVRTWERSGRVLTQDPHTIQPN